MLKTLKIKLVFLFVLLSMVLNASSYSWITKDYQETITTNNTTRYFRLAYPSDLQRIDGIFVNFNASSQDARDEYLRPYFKEFIRGRKFAFIGSKGLEQPPGGINGYIMFSNLFQNTIISFANQSGHPEIINAPLALFGFSAGGSQAYVYAKNTPSKVLGVSVISGIVDLPPMTIRNNFLTVPFLSIASEHDVNGVTNRLVSLILTNRLFGFRGSYSLVQNGTHSDSFNQYSIGMAHLNESVNLAYPINQCVLNGPLTLNTIPENNGWLVDPSTIASSFCSITNWSNYVGNKSQAYWLANKNLAYVYRSFSCFNPLLNITSPQTTSEMQAGALTLTVNDSLFSGWDSLNLYDFGTNILSKTSGAASFTINVGEGMHVWHVIATKAGAKAISRPVLVYANVVNIKNLPCISNNPPPISVTNSFPLVSIVNLINGSVFTNINNLLIQVKSSDSDGFIIKTELYGDNNLIGFSTTSNLNYGWNNISPGNHSVYAKTTDNNNATVSSSIINFNIITNGPIVVPPIIIPPSSNTTNAVTSYFIGRIRNDFTGWLGFKLTVGPKPLIVNSIGRFNHIINASTHIVKFVNTNGTDIVGANVLINNLNKPINNFVYVDLSNPITLSPSTSYYLVCQEVNGGDSWATDNYGTQNTLITTTSDLINNGPILNGSGSYTSRKLINGTFEPLNFKYTFTSQLTNSIPTNNVPTNSVPTNIPPVIPMGFFVSPAGSPTGNGTINSPLDLQTALNHPTMIKPGNTIWLRQGIYTHAPQGATVNPANQGYNFYSKLMGTANNPIIVRSYPGEQATIDGGAWPFLNANARPTMEIQGAYTWFMDLEITSLSTEARFSSDDSSFPVSITRSDGASVHGIGIKIINCIINNLTAGLSAWATAGDFEAYGNTIFNNGWQGTPHPHGHNIYTQNNTTSNPKNFLFNFLINAFQNNIQAYGSSDAEVAHYRFLNNFSINSPFLIGGRTDCHLQDNQVINNYFYNSDMALVYSLGPNYIDIIARNNYIVDGMFQIGAWQNASVDGNTVITSNGGILIDIVPITKNVPLPPWKWSSNAYFVPSANENNFAIEGEGFINFANWKARSGFDNNSSYTIGLPTANLNILTKNKYDSNKAFIIIYNWEKKTIVNLDISSLGWAIGSKYELRSVQDYSNDIGANILQTQMINIDMKASSHSIAIPRGDNKPIGPNTFPNFGGFVLINKGP